MGIYLGLLLVALAIGYLVVRITQSRNSGMHTGKADKRAPISRKKPYRRKQKGAIGSGSRLNPAAKAIERSVVMAGDIRKPWGW